MTSSPPEPSELTLSDGSKLEARCFGDFVLLQRETSSESSLALVGRAIFERSFDFVDEVIATEVEICLAVNQHFEPQRLCEIEQLAFGGAATTSQRHELSILIDQQHEDWDAIEEHSGLSKSEYIERLLDCRLSVAMTGFIPGFIYLKGLPVELQIPRKSNPATRTRPGTFAIGGKYAGVYSLPSAAGWNCVGRIAEKLLDETALPPVNLGVGDSVSLRRIDQAEFNRLTTNAAIRETTNASRIGDDFGKLEFEHPGTLSLIQDQGRTGHAWYAIPRSGPLDPTSAQLANTIVGNPLSAPIIECHFTAPRIRFATEAMVCLTGADMSWNIDGSPVETNSTVSVTAGGLLSGSAATDHCRAYIAIHGQIETTCSFGSAATYVHAKFGGNGGKALAAGDGLRWRKPSRPVVPLQLKFDRPSSDSRLQLQPGPEFDWLDAASAKAISAAGFSISRNSDRMGARLDGPQLSTNGKRLSDSVTLLPGMIQLTPQGQLIVVLQDGQTTGGYPRIGYLNPQAIELLNQTTIGQPFRFAIAD